MSTLCPHFCEYLFQLQFKIISWALKHRFLHWKSLLYIFSHFFLQKTILLHHLVLKFYDFHQPHKKWRQNMFYYCSLSKYPSYSCQTVINMNKNISRCNNIYRHTMPGSARQSTKRLWQNSSQFSFWCGQVWTKCGQSVDKLSTPKIKTS